jgi:hypothetical protein
MGAHALLSTCLLIASTVREDWGHRVTHGCCARCARTAETHHAAIAPWALRLGVTGWSRRKVLASPSGRAPRRDQVEAPLTRSAF